MKNIKNARKTVKESAIFVYQIIFALAVVEN